MGDISYDVVYIDEETFTDEDWFDMILAINEALDDDFGKEER